MLGAMAALALAAASAPAAEPPKPEELIRNLISVKAVEYDFVQFNPRGEQVSGIVKVQRPGKVRFEYDQPSPLTVVADGRSLGVNNRKLGTWTLYPLDKTPLGFILDSAYDPGRLKTVSADVTGNITSVVVSDPSVFGDSRIRLVFDNTDGALRQWTVTDSTKQETTVILYNPRTDMTFGGRDFEIPYSEIRAGSR